MVFRNVWSLWWTNCWMHTGLDCNWVFEIFNRSSGEAIIEAFQVMTSQKLIMSPNIINAKKPKFLEMESLRFHRASCDQLGLRPGFCQWTLSEIFQLTQVQDTLLCSFQCAASMLTCNHNSFITTDMISPLAFAQQKKWGLWVYIFISFHEVMDQTGEVCTSCSNVRVRVGI